MMKLFKRLLHPILYTIGAFTFFILILLLRGHYGSQELKENYTDTHLPEMYEGQKIFFYYG